MLYNHHVRRVLAGVAALVMSTGGVQAGTVGSHQKISDTEGDFTGTLVDVDLFGNSLVAIGDLDGDGVVDLASGAPFDDDGCVVPQDCNRGAVWVLFMNTDGTVKGHQKISSDEGNFTGGLGTLDEFGDGLASLGDLDGEGPSVLALAVGAQADDDGGPNRGAVWVLFLNSNGTVSSHKKISSTQGNFAGPLDDFDFFGYHSLAALGDLDGDGVEDLAVGAPFDDDGGEDQSANRGAVWILFLNDDGTVKWHRKISSTAGNFTGTLKDGDEFSDGLACLGDIDGDGVVDLAVGAPLDDDGGGAGEDNRGAVWVLFLNSDGTVKTHQKISDTTGGFTGAMDTFDLFGITIAALGDRDGNGVGDMAVGAADDDGGMNRGAAWLLYLNSNGTVRAHDKISDTEGDFTGTLDDNDYFGWGLASMGDLDGNGVVDLASGASEDDDGGPDRGSVWMLFLNEPCPWDCGSIDGVVDTVDFLVLLSQWGHLGASCDFHNDGVDTIDFLGLLAAWGACP